jgi:quercetin dioxygenase-like cupin family protein
MDSLSLNTLGDSLLATAREEVSSGRAAQTIQGGHEHPVRQTAIALLAGHELGEHDSPGEATLQVLRGRVRLVASGDSWEGSVGDYLSIPPVRHSLAALDDSVVLLTVLAEQ